MCKYLPPSSLCHAHPHTHTHTHIHTHKHAHTHTNTCTHAHAQPEGECNFNVFYELCAGASETQRELWGGFESYTNFRLLRGSDSGKERVGLDDRQKWTELVDALGEMGFGSDVTDELWRLCVGLLWLGNVDEWERLGEGEGDMAT